MKFLASIYFLAFVLLIVGCSGVEQEVKLETAPLIMPEELTQEEEVEYKAEQKKVVEAQVERKIEVAEKEMVVVKSGNFVGIASGHNAEGGVMVKESKDKVLIELDDDFFTDKGPDLYLTLTQEQSLTGEDPVQLDVSKIKRIEPLASRKGTQIYEVSKKDFESFGHAVVIWCNKFNVVFGAAVLK